jgi:nucleoside-diphosphate-sugar epimerase
MRVLLTGSTGFVGKHVAYKLISEGVDLVTVGRSANGIGNEHIQVDLLSIDDYLPLIREIGATHLIHLAWYVEHGKYWSSPLNLDWIKATTMLVKAFCIGGGQHITISGTCAEYDWDYGYCKENLTPTNPGTIYGTAKDVTRRMCQITSSEHGVPLAWGRVFFPYGKGEPETRLLPALASALKYKKAKLSVNGDFYRDFLHVMDVANALVMLSKNNVTGCINISSNEPVQIRNVVTMMAEMLSSEAESVLISPVTKLDEPKVLVGNNDLLTSLGWKRNIDLIDGIKDFL